MMVKRTGKKDLIPIIAAILDENEMLRKTIYETSMLEFNACMTGDCDHDHANKCLTNLQYQIKAECEIKQQALSASTAIDELIKGEG